MELTRQISSQAKAEKGKKYEILEDDLYIGGATLLEINGDNFTFKILLNGNRKAENYDYMFNVDLETHELLGLRGKMKSKY